MCWWDDATDSTGFDFDRWLIMPRNWACLSRRMSLVVIAVSYCTESSGATSNSLAGTSSSSFYRASACAKSPWSKSELPVSISASICFSIALHISGIRFRSFRVRRVLELDMVNFDGGDRSLTLAERRWRKCTYEGLFNTQGSGLKDHEIIGSLGAILCALMQRLFNGVNR